MPSSALVPAFSPFPRQSLPGLQRPELSSSTQSSSEESQPLPPRWAPDPELPIKAGLGPSGTEGGSKSRPVERSHTSLGDRKQPRTLRGPGFLGALDSQFILSFTDSDGQPIKQPEGRGDIRTPDREAAGGPAISKQRARSWRPRGAFSKHLLLGQELGRPVMKPLSHTEYLGPMPSSDSVS